MCAIDRPRFHAALLKRRLLSLLLFASIGAGAHGQAVSYTSESGTPYAVGVSTLARAGDGWLAGMWGLHPSVMRLDSSLQPVWALDPGKGSVTFATANGGGLFAGGHTLPEGSGGAFLVKLDDGGNRLWGRKIISDRPLFIDCADATADGGVALAGSYGEEPVVLRFSADGKVRWARRFAVTSSNVIFSLRSTRDGGFMAAGQARNTPWLLRLDGDGNVLWNHAYGNAGRARSVIELKEGGFVAVGRTTETIERKTVRIWIARLDAKGGVVWEKYARGIDEDQALDVIETTEGKFVVSGSSKNAGGGLLLMAITRDGGVLWSRVRINEQSAGSEGVPNQVVQAGDGGVLFSLALHGVGLATLGADGTSGSCALFVPAEFTLTDLEASPKGSYDLTVSDAHMETGDWAVARLPLLPHASASCLPALAIRRPALQEPTSLRLQEYRKLVAARAALAKQVQDLLVTRHFRELDDAFDRMRKSPRTLGDPLQFEEELAYQALIDREFSRRVGHDVQKQRLDEWLTARPASVAAWIACVAELDDWAWRQRGSGFSSEVTEKAAGSADAIWEKALKMLASAPAGVRADPYYFVIAVELAGSNGNSVEQIAKESCALAPFPGTWLQASNYMMPKWGGTYAGFRLFLDEARQCTAARFGQQVIARIAARTSRDRTADYHAFGIPWPPVREGYRQMIAASADWLPTYHNFAQDAQVNDDRATGHELFQMPELAWSTELDAIWQRAVWETARSWAVSAGTPEPASAQAASRAAAPVTSPGARVVYGEDERKMGVNGFFVTTSQGTFGIATHFGPTPISSLGGLKVTSVLPRPDDPMLVSSVVTVDGRPSAPALRVGNPPKAGDTVYVVACRPTAMGGPCVEMPFEATVQDRRGTKPGFGDGWLLPSQAAANLLYSGSPVVDLTGSVVAIAYGPMDHDGQKTILIYDLAPLLRP